MSDEILTSYPKRAEDGFSLLELVVAVSIILIIGVVGLVSYQSYTDNAKEAAVTRAAHDVFTSAVTTHTVNDEELYDVAAQYNATNAEIHAEIRKDFDNITVIATGWNTHVAVRSTDPKIYTAEDVPGGVVESDGYDIDDYHDGVFRFTTYEANSPIYLTGLSEHATIAFNGGEPQELVEGRNTLPGVGEYVIRGGFTNIGIESVITKIHKVTEWKDTGTLDTSRLFFKNHGITEVVAPPETVQDMSYMFSHVHGFNQNLNSWNTENVTSMIGMFHVNRYFNNGGEPLTWETGNVTNMNGMFFSAYNFNQDISTWDVSNVNSMQHMFRYNHQFNQDISEWDTSNVTNMLGMFSISTRFNQDISNWDVSNVETYEDFTTDKTPIHGTNKVPEKFRTPSSATSTTQSEVVTV